MRVVVTRPEADAERTAAAVRARGHDVLVTPLMRVEPIAVDLGGEWSALAITSANAPNAIARNPARETLAKLPLLAVGRRSAEAAQQAGFADVTSADGDVRELVRLIETSRRKGEGPVLYTSPGKIVPAISLRNCWHGGWRLKCVWCTARSQRRCLGRWSMH
jgi:uroporphyrinogen-III synthase